MRCCGPTYVVWRYSATDSRSLYCISKYPALVELCVRASYLLGDYSRAVKIANRAIELAPDVDPWLIFQRGLAKLELGLLTDALLDVSDVLAHATEVDDKAFAYNFIAQIQRRSKQFAEAEAAINLAIQLQPKDASNYYEAALIRRINKAQTTLLN